MDSRSGKSSLVAGYKLLKEHHQKEEGPLRLGVTDIIAERARLVKELEIEEFEIYSREEVSAKWGTFTDPWGNRLGLFEYLDKKEENDRINTNLGV